MLFAKLIAIQIEQRNVNSERSVFGPLAFSLVLAFSVSFVLCFSNVAKAGGTQDDADAKATVNAPLTFSGLTMGPIQYRVVITDEEVQDPAAVENEVADRLERVNQLMSTYIESSDVSRFNNAGKNQWVEIDRLTLQVIKQSLEISEMSGGAFDITVGPAVNLWQFGPEKDETQSAPTGPELDEVIKVVGYRNLELKEDPPSLRKSIAGVQIDLSAIAKGFAVDQVASGLDERGIKNFMVEVGGEVFAKGRGASGVWRIGIEKPDESMRSVDKVVTLDRKGMATSGDYRNFRMIDGKRYSHAIDPRTCKPVELPPATSSVIADSCMVADAIATALMAMPESERLQFCKEQGVDAYIVNRNDNGKLVSSQTDAFPLAELKLPSGRSKDEPRSILPVFFATLAVFGIAILGMAVGAIFGNKPIAGSCGGLAAQQSEDGSSACSMCTKPVTECPDYQAATETAEDA